MDKLAVEVNREYYPMTFYPESLEVILQQLDTQKTPSKPVFALEPISLSIKQVHYYNEIKVKQFLLGCIAITLFLISITTVLLFNPIIGLNLTLFNLPTFIGYFSLERYKNNLRKDLIFIDKKISSRQYQINSKTKSKKNNVSPSYLLLDSLDQRDSIYDFSIDNSANKGLSEAYFLSYLTKWFAYPWRILEHCQFEDNNEYTPTADFILINDELKLAIDLEIDEPYTLKESLPIHLVEDKKYIYRDRFFLSLGYIVIRFAEYQIVKYPDYCCWHIARVLNQFLDQDIKISVPNSTNITPLKPEEWKVKTWTQRESQIMALHQIRDIYLQPVKVFNSANEIRSKPPTE